MGQRISRGLVAAALYSASAAAQWQVYNVGADAGQGVGDVAAVTNANGDSLRVYRGEEGFVYGEFVLREGFHTLARSTCPTYQIDLKRPVALRSGRDGCEVSERSARFVLGLTEGGHVESAALRGLMDGTRLRFRFHLTGLGYRETEFSLRGSKHALNRAIGTDASVVKEREPGPPVTVVPDETSD